MSPGALEQRLSAYFHDKGRPVGEPLEEDLPPLVELLRALAALPELPAAGRPLAERLILEQLPWVEDRLAASEVERLQGHLAALCEPARMSDAKDAAILRALHVAAPQPRPAFGFLPRFFGPGLSLCAGLAVMLLVIGRPGLTLAPPSLEIERLRGAGYPVGQIVELRLGAPAGGHVHLFDVNAQRSVSAVLLNRALSPGRKTVRRFEIKGPPGLEVLLAACTSGPIPDTFPRTASADELKAHLTGLARARNLKVSFEEIRIQVVR